VQFLNIRTIITLTEAALIIILQTIVKKLQSWLQIEPITLDLGSLTGAYLTSQPGNLVLLLLMIMMKRGFFIGL